MSRTDPVTCAGRCRRRDCTCKSHQTEPGGSQRCTQCIGFGWSTLRSQRYCTSYTRYCPSSTHQCTWCIRTLRMHPLHSSLASCSSQPGSMDRNRNHELLSSTLRHQMLPLYSVEFSGLLPVERRHLVQVSHQRTHRRLNRC